MENDTIHVTGTADKSTWTTQTSVKDTWTTNTTVQHHIKKYRTQHIQQYNITYTSTGHNTYNSTTPHTTVQDTTHKRHMDNTTIDMDKRHGQHIQQHIQQLWTLTLNHRCTLAPLLTSNPQIHSQPVKSWLPYHTSPQGNSSTLFKNVIAHTSQQVRGSSPGLALSGSKYLNNHSRLHREEFSR